MKIKKIVVDHYFQPELEAGGLNEERRYGIYLLFYGKNVKEYGEEFQYVIDMRSGKTGWISDRSYNELSFLELMKQYG